METNWLDVDTPHCLAGLVKAEEVQVNVAVRVVLGLRARRVAQGGSWTKMLLLLDEESLSIDSLSFLYANFEASPWGAFLLLLTLHAYILLW